MIFVTDLFEIGMLAGVRDFHVHAGAHASAKVRGTGREVASVVIALKTKLLIQGVDSSAQAPKHGPDVAAFLHADDSKLVFLVDPDQECLVGVVEDATSLRPHLVDAGAFQEPVSLLEQEVVVHKLLASFLVHAHQRVVIAFQIVRQRLQHAHDL